MHFVLLSIVLSALSSYCSSFVSLPTYSQQETRCSIDNERLFQLPHHEPPEEQAKPNATRTHREKPVVEANSILQTFEMTNTDTTSATGPTTAPVDQAVAPQHRPSQLQDMRNMWQKLLWGIEQMYLLRPMIPNSIPWYSMS
jgi:hypothetical protein